MGEQSMVERVALAMSHERVNIGHVPLQSIWLSLARAAIEAMREPTHEMISRGYLFVDTGNQFDTCSQMDLEDAWRAMIDAALSANQDREG